MHRPAASAPSSATGPLQAGSPFLTVPEAAALLRVPLSWVYERTRQPDGIPCYRAGRTLVFDREEVLRWFRETCRHRLLPGDRRRRKRAPDGPRGSQRVKRPGVTRVSANGPAPVAEMLPRRPGK